MRTATGSVPNSAVRRGFTLIELLMVLGLIAIFFFTLGIPAFVQAQKNKKSALRQAVLDVQTGLRSARSQAIFNQTPTEFVMRPQPGGVQLTVENARGLRNSSSAFRAGSSASGGIVKSEKFAATMDPSVDIKLLDVNGVDILRLEVEDPEARVRFHPNGVCDDFRLVLQSPERITRLITTEVTTGIATVEVVEP